MSSVTDMRVAWEGYTMQLVTRGDWRRCEGTRNAAAIAALGVPIAPQKTFRVREGTERVVYLHEPVTSFPEWRSLGPIKEMLRAWKEGKLAATHAFVDARRAIHNAEALRAWALHGVPCTLGYEEASLRTRLAEGLPAPHAGPYARVTSLAKAAALATLGFPVIALQEAEAGAPRFVLSRLSVPMIADHPSARYTFREATLTEHAPIIYDAAELLAGERDETLPITHPFRLACLAAKTWLDLLRIVADDAAMLMYQSRGMRSAFVHSQADKLVIDRSEAFAAGRST